jgi:hypothetical protein
LFAYFNAGVRAALAAAVNPGGAGIDPLRAANAVLAGIALVFTLPSLFQGGSSFEVLPAYEAGSDEATATTIDPVEQCSDELANLIDVAEDEADEDGDGRVSWSDVHDRLQEDIGSTDPRFTPLMQRYTNFQRNQELYGNSRASDMADDEYRSYCRTSRA